MKEPKKTKIKSTLPTIVKKQGSKDEAKSLIEFAMRTQTYKLSENFMHNGSIWELKKNAPPTEKQGGEIIAALMNLKGAANLLDDETSWMIGNVTSELKDYYGDQFNLGILSNFTNLAENTLRHAEKVFKAFKETRVRGLTFSHHKEAYYTKDLKPINQVKVLKQALRLNLGVRETRSLCKVAVATGTKFLNKDCDPMDVLNAMDEKPKVENHYLVINKKGIQEFLQSDLTDEILQRSKVIVQIKPTMELIKYE